MRVSWNDCGQNAEGTSLNTVLPGKPAEICGLRGVPHAGDELMVMHVIRFLPLADISSCLPILTTYSNAWFLV